VWTANRFVAAEASDGGVARIPTSEQRHPVTKKVVETAGSNEEKTRWFRKEFFPAKMAMSSVPDNPDCPPPAWQWTPTSDANICDAIERMRPWKATFPDSPANCVFRECTNILVPFIGPIFRSLNDLEHYPKHWAELRIIVLRKPGKPDYTNPAAHRPIALTRGMPRLWYATKNLQCVAEAELTGILPNNQYG
ncbi:hypothetical protein C8F04DRAFT_877579, partial [Mycena alexandri]